MVAIAGTGGLEEPATVWIVVQGEDVSLEGSESKLERVGR
jgi:hypothetical protein